MLRKPSAKMQRQLMELGINWLIEQHLKPKPSKKISKPRKVVKARRMSAKARKAISIRMKKMWAEKNRK